MPPLLRILAPTIVRPQPKERSFLSPAGLVSFLLLNGLLLAYTAGYIAGRQSGNVEATFRAVAVMLSRSVDLGRQADSLRAALMAFPRGH